MFKKSKYKKYYNLIILVLIIAVIFLWIATSKKAEERIKERNINVLIRTDGSVHVEDIWDIYMVNSRTLYQSFDNANDSNFSNIKVSYYDKKTSTWEPMLLNEYISSSGVELLNNYHAGYFKGNYEIAWGVGYLNRRGREQFKIEYDVNGPINKYSDIAEYNHMFVGKDFEIPIEKFNATITFPAPLRDESSHIWGHGAPSGNINFKDGKVQIIANKIPANTFVEGRVLFPKEIVYMAPEINIKMKDAILNEEQKNTDTTVVSAINDINRQSYINKAQAGIILMLGIIVFLEATKIINLKKKFPKGNIREWDRYTGLPETKLDMYAANIIYKDKGAQNFLISVLMKLSHNKYIEIIEVNKDFKNPDLNIFDENIVELSKIVEKLALESNIQANPIEVARIYSEIENDIRKEQAKELKINVNEINKIKYKLNFNKINKAEESGKLEADEKFVIEYLKKLCAKGVYSVSKFEKYLTKNLKKNKSNLKPELFKSANINFKNEITNVNGIAYIEQYQVIKWIVKDFENFDNNYTNKIEKEKAKLTTSEVYSTEKEKKGKELLKNPIIEIISISILVYLLLTNLVGTLQFNEAKYIEMIILTAIASIGLIFINKIQYGILNPFLKEKGMNIRAEYQGLYNFLNNDSFIAEYPEESVIIWGEFLVLATYFGIASKVLKTLKKVHPQVVTELQSTSYVDSYYLWNTMRIADLSKRNLNVAAAGRMIATGASAISSGGGGGFTSGGGGGFGGGGGGSR